MSYNRFDHSVQKGVLKAAILEKHSDLVISRCACDPNAASVSSVMIRHANSVAQDLNRETMPNKSHFGVIARKMAVGHVKLTEHF